MKYFQVIKMSLAFFFAMEIALFFDCQYAASAGIVALLTIQNTKKETFIIGLKRVFSFCLSFICAFCVFYIFGFSVFSFAIFLMIFVGFSCLGHLEDGIAMNAVITTHYLIEEQMSVYWIQNELMIFMIGIVVGIIINLYMPSQMKRIQKSLDDLDKDIKDLLLRMSHCLLKEQKHGTLYQSFDCLFEQVETMQNQTYLEMNNRLLNETRYEFNYLIMRKEQLSILHDIYNFVVQIDFVGDQAQLISSFLSQMSLEYHAHNDMTSIKEKFLSLKLHFQQDQLPVTRDEFENRAKLYMILCYLEKFIDIKYSFVHE